MNRQKYDVEGLGEFDSRVRTDWAPRRKSISARWSGRKLWLNIHLYLALGVGFLFVLLGLTGSCNVFIWELEEIGLARPEVQTNAQTHVDLDEVLKRLRQRYPRRHGTWNLEMPGYGHDYLWAIYPEPEETADELYAPHRLVIDPASGEIVAESYWARTLWTFIYEIHATLLTGLIGAEIGDIGFKSVCFLGLFLVISVASGIYLWWPRGGQFLRAMRFKRGASKSRFDFDLHRVAGFYASIILIMIAFSGFCFGFGDYLKAVVEVFSPVKAEQFKNPEGLKSTWFPGAKAISVSAAVATAEKIFPEAELRGVDSPQGRDGFYTVIKRQDGEINRKGPRTRIWIDQYSGEVLASEDPEKFTAGETFFNLLWPMHNGEFLGLASRILWCLSGFAPLILYVTGIRIWLKKRSAREIKESKNSRKQLGRTSGVEACPDAFAVAEKAGDKRC